jgi:hypothetical protein
VWQDSNKVGFCTTVHDGTEWLVKNRKHPKGTSTSDTISKQPFYMFNPPVGCKEPYERTHLLPISGAIDDYNHYMGGVDIADQLRAGFSTQQRGVDPGGHYSTDYLILQLSIPFTFQSTEGKIH